MRAFTYPAITSGDRRTQRGQTVVIFTMLCTLLLIPIAGLGVDGAIMYLMKSKLSAAVDAAALATARGLNAGQGLSAQEAAATTTGTNYFNANLPAGTMGETLSNLSITFPTPKIANTTVVNVQATISVPMTFMRLLRFPTANLTASGTATRRISNIILVLDRSYSLQLGGQCSNVIQSAQQFVNLFAEGLDTMGLVDFQASAKEDFYANSTFKSSINSYIQSMQCSGYTNTAQGLAVAYKRLQTINQPLANNVIVLFTDGNADTISGVFPVRSSSTSDSRYNWQNIYQSQSSQGLVTVSKSPCSPSTLTGVLINAPGGVTSANDVAGVFQDTAQSITWTSPYQSTGPQYPYPAAEITASNCTFTQTTKTSPKGSYDYPTNTLAARNDIAYLPTTDDSYYSISLTNSYWTQSSDYVPSGPYASSKVLRVDTVQSVNDAALSDADNMATAIRTGVYNSGKSTSQITATIYTIGLDNPPLEVVNSTFLERVANDPSAPNYNPNQPIGMYKYCTPPGLQAAFVAIASQILRLSGDK